MLVYKSRIRFACLMEVNMKGSFYRALTAMQDVEAGEVLFVGKLGCEMGVWRVWVGTTDGQMYAFLQAVPCESCIMTFATRC